MSRIKPESCKNLCALFFELMKCVSPSVIKSSSQKSRSTLLFRRRLKRMSGRAMKSRVKTAERRAIRLLLVLSPATRRVIR